MTSVRPLQEGTIASLLVQTWPWLSCDDCFHQLDTFAEALVADPEHDDPAMVTHLAGCSACREEVNSLLALLREDEHVPGRHRGHEEEL